MIQACFLRVSNGIKCTGCLVMFQSSSLVIGARQFLFHVKCFRCNVCGILLKKGDRFGMHANTLYCDAHYCVNDSGSKPNADLQQRPQGQDSADGLCKPKRTRTSFSCEQLSILRDYFNINPNPNAMELKTIAKSTKLEKKVLQVKQQ